MAGAVPPFLLGIVFEVEKIYAVFNRLIVWKSISVS